MKIALGQITSTNDLENNITLVEKFLAQAATDDADLIVFPEATMCAFGNRLPEAAKKAAEWQTAMQDLAETHRVALIVGEFTPADHGRVNNHAALYRPGETRVAYTKIHLFDAFGFKESDGVHPGEDIVVEEIAGTKVGFAICYDIRFPKLFAELSRAGAQVIVAPTSWGAGEGKLKQWQILTAARALDSNTFIAAVDQADPTQSGITPGSSKAPTGIGHSIISTPFGETVAELGPGPEYSCHALDLELIAKAQATIPVLTNAKLGY